MYRLYRLFRSNGIWCWVFWYSVFCLQYMVMIFNFGVEKDATKQQITPRTVGGVTWPGQNSWVYLLAALFSWVKFTAWRLSMCHCFSWNIFLHRNTYPWTPKPINTRIERPDQYGINVITPTYECCEFSWHEVTHASTKKNMISWRNVSRF